MQVWKTWSYGAITDLTAMYGVGGSPPERGIVTWGTRQTTVDYPPVTLYGLGLVGGVYRHMDPAFKDSAALTVLLKISILLMDVLSCVAVWWLARLVGGSRAGRLAAVSYWCNPSVLMDGAVLGYLDTWAGALAVAGTAAAAAGIGWVAGLLLALACLTKVQAIFVVPAAALLLWMRPSVHEGLPPTSRVREGLTRMIQAATAGVAATLLAIAPFGARGALPNMVQGIGSLLRHDMLSGTAANLWWIVTWLLRASYAVRELGAWAAWTMTVRILGVSRVVALGYPNPRPIGIALAAAATAWALWRAYRSGSPAAIIAAGAFAVHAYFTLAVQVHENHLFLAVPLLAIAATALPLLRGPFMAVSAVFALNLYLFYGIGRGYALPPRHLTVVDATVLLSIANVAVLSWFAAALHHATNPATVDRNRDTRHV